VAGAHMLQHPDRHDAVVALLHPAVVLEVEAHPVGQPGLLGAPVRHRVLFARQGHAIDPQVVDDAGEEQAKPAPARADIQHPLARLEVELGGEVELLVPLRRLQVVLGVEEIGAAVLPVAVEEQVEQRVAQVVVMGHLALGEMDRIPVPERGPQVAQMHQHAAQRPAARAAHVQHADVQEIVQRGPVLEDQSAIHIGFADSQFRIQHEALVEPAVGDPDRRAGSLGAPAVVALPVGIDQGQMPDGDELAKRARREHGSHPLFVGLTSKVVNHL